MNKKKTNIYENGKGPKKQLVTKIHPIPGINFTVDETIFQHKSV